MVSIGLSLTAVGSIWFCMWQGTLLVLTRTLRVDSDKKNVCICWSGTASWHLKKQNWFSAMHHNWHMLQWDTLSVQWEFCVCKSFWISGMEYYGSQDSPIWLFCPCCCYFCAGTMLWLFKVCLLHTFFLSQGQIIYFFILWWFSFSFSVSLSVLFLWTLLFSLSFIFLSLLTETQKHERSSKI